MASLGLIADYGSSDDEQEASVQQKLNEGSVRESTNYLILKDEDNEGEKKTKKCKKSKKEKLVNPSKGLREIDSKGSTQLPNPFSCNDATSVFYNPFHQEQEAKKSMLEKHVKLTDNPKDVVEINGKKICYNYRKGRCKFGHKCKYAHDSDLSSDAIKVNALPSQSNGDTNNSALYNSVSKFNENRVSEEEDAGRKRKPGLSEGLKPNKRSRQNYTAQQQKETPWLSKR
ncbi:Zinc finger CCCH-type [Trinorchestia longiramus]|nr:Zinc finger CCCH-type [Trinorchestia longiramus]